MKVVRVETRPPRAVTNSWLCLRRGNPPKVICVPADQAAQHRQLRRLSGGNSQAAAARRGAGLCSMSESQMRVDLLIILRDPVGQEHHAVSPPRSEEINGRSPNVTAEGNNPGGAGLRYFEKMDRRSLPRAKVGCQAPGTRSAFHDVLYHHPRFAGDRQIATVSNRHYGASVNAGPPGPFPGVGSPPPSGLLGLPCMPRQIGLLQRKGRTPRG